jgi:hypothetical protein
MYIYLCPVKAYTDTALLGPWLSNTKEVVTPLLVIPQTRRVHLIWFYLFLFVLKLDKLDSPDCHRDSADCVYHSTTRSYLLILLFKYVSP